MANEQVAYMKVLHGIFKNLYQDSVSLMQVSASIINLPGIKQASVVMGSETNLIQLRDARLGDNIAAGPNDLIIAIMGEDEACEQALALAKEKLNLFMKNQLLENGELYERFGINPQIFSLLMTTSVDQEGKLQIQWGEQKIS